MIQGLRHLATDWDALQPPDNMGPAHQEMGEALHAIAARLDSALAGTAIVAGSPVPELDRLSDAWRTWESAATGNYGIRFWGVTSKSMEPALCDGDMLMTRPVEEPIERWEIIAFHADSGRESIKRLVGLPGETIEVRGGDLYINGSRRADDTYPVDRPTYSFGPYTIPAGRYFVLGDNRNNSDDSHHTTLMSKDPSLGPSVPLDAIDGVAPADVSGCRVPGAA